MPNPTPATLQMYLATIDTLCREELGRIPDIHNPQDLGFAILLDMALRGSTGDALRLWLHAQPEAATYRQTQQPAPPPSPPSPVPPAPTPPPLTRIGHTWHDPQSRIWRWQGASQFLLLERWMGGESITPTLDWLRSCRVSVIRVFVAGVPWEGHPWLYQDPLWRLALREFALFLHHRGFRLEATVCTHRATAPYWPQVLQTAYDTLALAAPSSTFIEWVNEPWVNDMIPLTTPINRRGIASAYGLQPSQFLDPRVPCPVLDYCTLHTDRDLDHFGRNGKELFEYDALQVPLIDDEPLGLADYDKEGSAARTTSLPHIIGHFATAALFGGSTIHSQCGLEGRAPTSAEPLTDSLAATIARIWDFIPPAALRGTYSRMGLEGFPLEWAEGDSLLSTTHGYARAWDHMAYVVIPVPRPTYVPRPKPGWRVAAELFPGVLKLVRT